MRKDQLVRALLKAAKPKTITSKGGGPVRAKPAAKRVRAGAGSAVGKNHATAKPTDARVRRRIDQFHSKLERVRNLATASGGAVIIKDRLVLMVRDPYWLHAHWELSRDSIERARVAMGQHWHTSRPVLRLLKTGANGAASVLRHILIHGQVSNWYIDVHDPPSLFRVEIGYLTADGHFHRLASSNPVSTPPSRPAEGSGDDLAENADRIFALSGGFASPGSSSEVQELLEERLGRPVGGPVQTMFGPGAVTALSRSDDFLLAVDADMVVYGVTQRDAHVTLQGEPVKLRPDGTFSVRLSMPDRRQVIPVVASSNDGTEQRTISIAVERNTKVMEPVSRDASS
jgi:hypothetical protein